MPLPINPLLTKTIQKSLTFATGEKAAELRAQGKNIISFGAGDPYHPFSDKIFQYGSELLASQDLKTKNAISKYAPVQGMPDLLDMIARKHEAQSGIKVNPNQVTVHFGGKQAINNFMQSVISDEKNEIILLTPAFVSYLPVITLARGKVKFINGKIENGFRVKPEEIEAEINKKTAAIIICSPNNPTGHMYSRDEMRALAESLANYDIRVFSDEVYDSLVFAPHEFTSMLEFSDILGERLVVSNGVSKSFAMTGLRLGWNITLDPQLVSCMNKVQGHTTSAVNTIAQKMSAFALSDELKDWSREYNEEYRQKINLLVDELEKIEGVKIHRPEGSLYAFPQFNKWQGMSYNGEGKSIINTQDLSIELLTYGLVAAVPGEAFYDNNLSLRISACPPENEIIEGVERIKEFLGNLK